MAENQPPSLPDTNPEATGEPSDFPETENEPPAPRASGRRRKLVMFAVIAVLRGGGRYGRVALLQ